MSAQMIYAVMYLEINLAAVILIAIIRQKTGGISRMVAQRNFAMAVHAEAVFFLSDTFYVMMKSGVLPYHKYAAMAAKELYFLATAWMCFAWFLYFEYMQDSSLVKSRKRVWIASSLVWVMALLLIVNLFTGILFYVDADGIYHRGSLFAVQYVLSYIYVLVSCSRALIGVFQKEKYAQRRFLIYLSLFPVAPAGAGILQFLYPELPLACAALSMATLVLYLNWVDEMISVDPLTKLNNRKQLSYYYGQWSHGENRGDEEKCPLYLLIIDANKFKGINDTYGHIEGDAALLRIADALRLGCRGLKRRANIARYGGDEFVVLAMAEEREEIDRLCEGIAGHLSKLNREAGAPYELTVSIGVAQAEAGVPLKELIEKADRELYVQKRGRNTAV